MSEGGGLERLAAACAAVRGRALRATAAAVVGAAALGLVVLSLLPAGAREGRGSWAPLLLAAAIWASLAAGVRLLGKVRRSVRPDGLADEADRAAGLGAGDVRGALELAGRADGGAGGLAALHRARVAERLAGLATDRLLPLTGPRSKRLARRAGWIVALALTALALSAIARPEPTLSAALALGAPWRTAFPPDLPRLAIEADPGAGRGEPAEVTIRAPGRERVRLIEWPAGGTPLGNGLAVPPGGELSARTGPIEVPTRVWAEDEEGTSSDTLLIRPVEPLLVEDLRLRVEYPAYLGRESEEYRGQIPPLVLPEGATLILSGETNLPLDRGILTPVAAGPGLFFGAAPASAAEASSAGAEEAGAGVADGAGSETPAPADRALALEVDETRFGARWAPRHTGRWEWTLEAAASGGDPILPEPLRVLVVPDLPPRIRLLYPAPDTTLGFERVMPLVVDVEDDVGLRRALLRRWRSGLGEDAAERSEALEPAPDGSRRAIFRHLLDLSGEELLPGDTIFYRIEAFDGHPRRGPARSGVFTLRVPTFREMGERRAEELAALEGAADGLEEALESLAEAAADAARQADAGSEEAAFEATEEARATLDEAERAREGLTGLEDELAALRDEVAESALADAGLEERLETLAERYETLAEEGLLEEIEALAEALRDLDPQALREALEALAGSSEALREQIEQTLGMLEQAALEGAIESARLNADELAEAQREVAEEADAPDFEEEQGAVAERAAELAEALSELERELGDAARETAADSARAAGERTDEARRSMEEARESAAGDPTADRTGDPAEGGSARRRAAEEAAEALEEAASALGSAGQDLSGEGREGAAETLARARSEALSLAEEEGRLADATRGEETADPESWRARQSAVRQGLENLLERLSEAGNEAAMLDQTTGAAAGEAAERMDGLLERLGGDGASRLPSRAEAEGVQESLNELARHLLAREQAARASARSSAGEQAAERMAQMAQQQQAVTRETSSLLVPGPRPAGEERLRERIQRRQQEIAERLGELDDPEGELLARPEELAEEAAELARRLGAEGPTQETLERQRRLFRRMLDAGRSLEDEDLDPNRRESRTGEARFREPPPIDPALLRGPRFPLPPEALLRELPLHYRALIFEYFDRLNREPPSAPDAGRRVP